MNYWAGCAFTFLGVAIPCAIQETANYQMAVHSRPPQAWQISIWGIAAIVSAALCFTCFIAYSQASRAESDSLNSVLEEMEEIESGFAQVSRISDGGA